MQTNNTDLVQLCNRCDQPSDGFMPYYHPDLQLLFDRDVVVYADICYPCAADLIRGTYITLDVLRLESVRMRFEMRGQYEA
jgi:hypothetical protein